MSADDTQFRNLAKIIKARKRSAGYLVPSPLLSGGKRSFFTWTPEQ